MSEPIRCPFVYANGRRCEGEILSAWRKFFRHGTVVWEPAASGDWRLIDPETSQGWDGPMSHVHLVCSLRGGHAGFMPDDPRMKFDALPERAELQP